MKIFASGLKTTGGMEALQGEQIALTVRFVEKFKIGGKQTRQSPD
jgi:hypothetical protein